MLLDISDRMVTPEYDPYRLPEVCTISSLLRVCHHSLHMAEKEEYNFNLM